MDDKNVCPVCFDVYKFPKLLPWKHTFCLFCLEDFLKGFTDKSTLVCPLSRENCYVTEKGFTELPTNYFVLIKKNPKYCYSCKKGNVSNFCHQYDKVFCCRCHMLHSHQIEQEKETGNDVEKDLQSFIYILDGP